MKATTAVTAALSALMIFSASAYADRGGRHDYPRHVRMAYPSYHHTNWVIPLMVGGVLGYALAEPRRESVTYIQTVQSPVVYPSQPIYQEQWVYFSDCDCQRKVLVPVR